MDLAESTNEIDKFVGKLHAQGGTIKTSSNLGRPAFVKFIIDNNESIMFDIPTTLVILKENVRAENDLDPYGKEELLISELRTFIARITSRVQEHGLKDNVRIIAVKELDLSNLGTLKRSMFKDSLPHHSAGATTTT